MTRTRYKCQFCGLILNAWLPVFQVPNGAMLLSHLHHGQWCEMIPCTPGDLQR